MRILRLTPNEYRSISGHPLVDPKLDPRAITVLFGPNGAGKSNLLEAVHWLFADAPLGYSFPQHRAGASELPRDTFPGWAVVELDQWRIDGKERRVLSEFLASPDTLRGVFWWADDQASFAEVIESLQSDVAQARADFSDSADSAPAEALIEIWAERLAETDAQSEHDDRRALLQEVLEQAIVTIGVGWPEMHVIPARLSETARQAATRIAEAGSAWERDPVLTLARIVIADSASVRPQLFLEPTDGGGDSLESTRMPELNDLVDNVWLVGTNTDKLALDLQEELEAFTPAQTEALLSRANGLLPDFVAERGALASDASDVTRLLFREHGSEETLLLGDLGEGVRRWAVVAALAALREARQGRPAALLLLDEPEAHLHVSALRSLRRWLVARNREGSGVIIASHAVELLDLPTEVAEFMIVTREDGTTRFSRVTDAVIDALDARAGEAGIGRADALRVARGFLIVEGEHDSAIVQHFYGDLLRTARVLVLPLRGTSNARALVDLEYLSRLGLPMAVLLDNVRPGFEARTRKQWTDEEHIVADLMKRLDGRVRIVSHRLPDIICTLPEEAVRRVAPAFQGWDAVLGRYEASRRRVNIKMHLASELGLTRSDGTPLRPGTTFVRQVLAAASDEDQAAAGLAQAITSAVTHISSVDRDTGETL